MGCTCCLRRVRRPHLKALPPKSHHAAADADREDDPAPGRRRRRKHLRFGPRLDDPINLAAPKAAAVQKALVEAGIDYRYLPAYSPDPWGAALPTLIEPCRSKLKTRLRTKAARTIEALEAELGPALATVTAQEAQGWFRLCGYPAPN